LRSAIGAPSAGLSLVGLRPRRARLRFTRQRQGNQKAVEEQEQAHGWTRRPAPIGEHSNPGGSLFGADVGPFYMPITNRVRQRGHNESRLPASTVPSVFYSKNASVPAENGTRARGSPPRRGAGREGHRGNLPSPWRDRRVCPTGPMITRPAGRCTHPRRLIRRVQSRKSGSPRKRALCSAPCMVCP
jgi:hypothetical protein